MIRAIITGVQFWPGMAGFSTGPRAGFVFVFQVTDSVTVDSGLKVLVKPLLYWVLYFPKPNLRAVLWLPNTS
jgi:hypothetical protein